MILFRAGVLTEPCDTEIVSGSRLDFDIACHKVALSAEPAPILTVPFRKMQQSAERMPITFFLTDIVILPTEKLAGCSASWRHGAAKLMKTAALGKCPLLLKLTAVGLSPGD
jgi:hypothetical protein